MDTVLKTLESKMKKSIQALENEYQALRTGRANAALFNNIQVEYYGAQTPLSQVGSISVPEARMVVIQPWDKTVLPAIEKAILKSELGLTPSNDGKLIRISFPALTADRRKELAKNAKQTAEKYKVGLRNLRREAIDELKAMEKESLISEDDLKVGETKVQKITDTYVAQVSDVAAAKEKEIMEI
ncbi:MAG: ribosome recycling factor [Sphaerochaetaceae bacterium]|nr:ribosome recycling factor [Sphaerochaetaceae bacterium]MDC7236414.1 ribosome recycling factor [Sphaerochaetaceae bacterium]MDC7250232.1 ribosome recycling factor [Sphaerochaetaceae bacterium]